MPAGLFREKSVFSTKTAICTLLLFRMPFKTQSKFTYSKSKIRTTRAICEICSKLTIKRPEQSYWHPTSLKSLWHKQISYDMNIQPFCAVNIQQIRLDSSEQRLHYPLKVDYELQRLTKLFTRHEITITVRRLLRKALALYLHKVVIRFTQLTVLQK